LSQKKLLTIYGVVFIVLVIAGIALYFSGRVDQAGGVAVGALVTVETARRRRRLLREEMEETAAAATEGKDRAAQQGGDYRAETSKTKAVVESTSLSDLVDQENER